MIRTLAAAFIVCLLISTPALGQSGVIVDRREGIPIRGSYVVKRIEVTGTVRDQV